MKLIIFGSTGTIGKELVRQALVQGHQVSAFMRDPAKLDLTNPNLFKHKGDVLKFEDVLQAIKGHDAVLCALGAGRKGQVRAEGTRHIIKAMERESISRLICQTTLGAGDSYDNLNFFWKRIMFGWFLKDAFEDHQIQEQYIMQSKLDWTIVRPAAFTNDAAGKTYKHGFGSHEKNLTLKISREHVAEFMLRQLKADQYLRKTPGLSY